MNSGKTTDFSSFFMRVACDHDSVLFSWHYNMLCILPVLWMNDEDVCWQSNNGIMGI